MTFKSFNVLVIYQINTLEHSMLSLFPHPGEFILNEIWASFDIIALLCYKKRLPCLLLSRRSQSANRTKNQSNPIVPLVSNKWNWNIFVSSIKFDYRTQSNPIERLGSITERSIDYVGYYTARNSLQQAVLTLLLCMYGTVQGMTLFRPTIVTDVFTFLKQRAIQLLFALENLQCFSFSF